MDSFGVVLTGEKPQHSSSPMMRMIFSMFVLPSHEQSKTHPILLGSIPINQQFHLQERHPRVCIRGEEISTMRCMRGKEDCCQYV